MTPRVVVKHRDAFLLQALEDLGRAGHGCRSLSLLALGLSLVILHVILPVTLGALILLLLLAILLAILSVLAFGLGLLAILSLLAFGLGLIASPRATTLLQSIQGFAGQLLSCTGKLLVTQCDRDAAKPPVVYCTGCLIRRGFLYSKFMLVRSRTRRIEALLARLFGGDGPCHRGKFHRVRFDTPPRLFDARVSKRPLDLEPQQATLWAVERRFDF